MCSMLKILPGTQRQRMVVEVALRIRVSNAIQSRVVETMI